jgi:hypothetical protein
MNTYKMRNVILIPMIVLAVNACAKRDSNLVKPSQAPVAGEKPADTTVTTGTAAEEAAKKALEMADGSLSYSPACKNPIKMDLSEKQDSLAITDLISESNKGTYNLVGTEYFAEADAAVEGDPKEQISAFGNEYQTPENMSAAVTDNQKVTITCHTTKPAEGKVSKISGSMDFANSFSAADGKGTVVRQDAVTAKNRTIKTVTTLYSSTTDLKQSLASASDVKIVIVKQASGDVTIKKQFTRPDLKTGKNIKVTMSATYKLATEVKAVETEAPKAATEETKAEEAR